MARLPRIDAPGIPQHVIARGVDRQPCFFREADYELYLSLLHDSAKRCACSVHAFVLMTNHVHLLVTGHTAGAVSSMMHRIGSGYVRRINHCYGRTGTLFEGRFRASLVQSERYLLSCMRYIELNPVRARLVRHPSHYRWSSFRNNAGIAPLHWLFPHDEYLRLGRSPAARIDAYQALVGAALDANELDTIRLHANKNCALGDRPFQAAIARMANRRAHVVSAGRPKKWGQV